MMDQIQIPTQHVTKRYILPDKLQMTLVGRNINKNKVESEMGKEILPKTDSRPHQGFHDLAIGTKVTLYYLGLLTLSIAISGFLYYRINMNIMSRKVSDISLQTLGSISANIYSVIDNVNNYSKGVLSDSTVQECLRNSEKRTNLQVQRNINRYLIGLIDMTPLISAVYLFDNFGNKYGADKLTMKSFRLGDIKEAEWYEDASKKKGGYILRLNAGNVFYKSNTGEPYISLIRLVNDLNTQKPIGVLIINTPCSFLGKSFLGVENRSYTGIIVKDEKNQPMVRVNDVFGVNIDRIIPADQKNYYSLTRKIHGKWYLLSALKMNRYGWRIISVIPFNELSRESGIFSMIAFAIIILNSLLIFLGSVFISKLITVPINKLLKSMKNVEKGKFEIVNIQTGNDEIGKLKDGYNIMIQQIQELLERSVAEQKIIRKTELEVLQAQIKPHFLYNTFDAISSLALAGRSNDVYTVMKSLGSYYRISLSKGNQIITIREEIETVKNYLTIQQIRYGDIFSAIFQVDEELADLPVLKLVLQPLVENALYHGVKPKGEKGVITIRVRREQENMELIVEDDGVGMDQSKLAEIMNPLHEKDRSSFGLQGTIERLRIFYGREDIFKIESAAGEGTVITISIPMKEF